MRRVSEAVVYRCRRYREARSRLELAKRGFGVVVVDKAGASGHDPRFHKRHCRFNLLTLRRSWPRHGKRNTTGNTWPDHVGDADESGLASFQRTGMVVLDTPIAPLDQVAALLAKVGVPFEEWDAPKLRERISGIDTGAYWPPKRIDDESFFQDATSDLRAIYMPDAGFVDDPQLAAHNLITAAQRLGVTVIFNRAVSQIIERTGHVMGVQLFRWRDNRCADCHQRVGTMVRAN